MLPDRVSNPEPLTYEYMAGQGIELGPLTLESDALPIASGGPAQQIGTAF